MICFDSADILVDVIFPSAALTASLRQLVALRHLHPVLSSDPVHVATRVCEHARVS